MNGKVNATATMKIAFISYEYPPDAAYGGIATYVYQAARMLASRGHHIEVFTSSPDRSGTHSEDGILVHRILEASHARFPTAIAGLFAARHISVQFDVLEGPEYGADAHEAVKLVPDIPLVVKLHTPSFLLTAITYEGLAPFNPMRLRLLAGRIRKYLTLLTKEARPLWRYTHKYGLEQERLHALEADEVVAPSRSLGEITTTAWNLDPARVFHIPYPYVPSPRLLEIPVDTSTNTVTFIGRLEVRKGVIDLARAVPLVLKMHAQTKFRFVGPSDESPKRNQNMRQYLEHMLGKYTDSIEFTGPVPVDAIADILASTDLCVFPSIWENFANVCLESMAAGRGVIASEAGGMAEMLDFGTVGRTVPPRCPAILASAINELLDNPELRMTYGRAARNRLLDEYNIDRIGALQEQSYQRAIENRQIAGSRAY